MNDRFQEFSGKRERLALHGMKSTGTGWPVQLPHSCAAAIRWGRNSYLFENGLTFTLGEH